MTSEIKETKKEQTLKKRTAKTRYVAPERNYLPTTRGRARGFSLPPVISQEEETENRHGNPIRTGYRMPEIPAMQVNSRRLRRLSFFMIDFPTLRICVGRADPAGPEETNISAPVQ